MRSSPADPGGGLLGGEILGDTLDQLRRAVQPRREVGGWATVDLDRAEIEICAALTIRDGAPPSVNAGLQEQLLGARCRLLGDPARGQVVLLEPSTEGRLAAGLARFGEGSLALYLLGDDDAPARARQAGLTLSTEGSGPFGPERLVITGPRDGPFLILAGLGS